MTWVLSQKEVAVGRRDESAVADPRSAEWAVR